MKIFTRSSTKAFRIIFFVDLRVFSVEIHGRREARKEIFSLLIYSAADLNIEIITASTREENYAIKKDHKNLRSFQ
jgi:hypothetical protein